MPNFDSFQKFNRLSNQNSIFEFCDHFPRYYDKTGTTPPTGELRFFVNTLVVVEDQSVVGTADFVFKNLIKRSKDARYKDMDFTPIVEDLLDVATGKTDASVPIYNERRGTHTVDVPESSRYLVRANAVRFLRRIVKETNHIWSDRLVGETNTIENDDSSIFVSSCATYLKKDIRKCLMSDELDNKQRQRTRVKQHHKNKP